MFEQAFKNIDDVLWRDAGCTSELDYTEQFSWLLFLKYLDGLLADKATEATLELKQCSPTSSTRRSGFRPAGGSELIEGLDRVVTELEYPTAKP